MNKTQEEKIEAIKKACVAANGDIMAVIQGCRVEYTYIFNEHSTKPFTIRKPGTFIKEVRHIGWSEWWVMLDGNIHPSYYPATRFEILGRPHSPV